MGGRTFELHHDQNTMTRRGRLQVTVRQESSVSERDAVVDDSPQPAGTAARPHNETVDLDTVFPPYDPGPWPARLSLRREDRYGDRGR